MKRVAPLLLATLCLLGDKGLASSNDSAGAYVKDRRGSWVRKRSAFAQVEEPRGGDEITFTNVLVQQQLEKKLAAAEQSGFVVWHNAIGYAS